MPSPTDSSKFKAIKPKPRRTPIPPSPFPLPPSLVSSLLGWFTTAARDLPWRRTLDAYAIWVSEIMLQQTQVKTVIPYWERWMRELPDVRTLATAPEQRVLKLWEGLGYYTRARNLQRAAQQIMAQHDGRFPRDYEAVLALPGVGRYTAGAISSIAYNAPTPILDGNVMRVLTRLFDIRENPRDKPTNDRLWHLATQLVQAAAPHASGFTLHASLCTAGPCSTVNQSLMELGATLCTPQNAKCPQCPVRSHCAALREGRVDELPNLGPRAAATAREFHAFVVERDGEFLVTQRPASGVNAGLWEFPNLEVTGETRLPADSLKLLLELTARCEPLCEVRHTITRYRITQRVFRVRSAAAASGIPTDTRWLDLEGLHALPFTSAHRRILRRLAAGADHSLPRRG